MARGGETRPHPTTKGAPEYDSAQFWDARFAEGRDVGEWLNSGEMVIATVMSELEGKQGHDEQRRVLHLGPGVSRLGEKLRDAFTQDGWRGSDIVVSLMQDGFETIFANRISSLECRFFLRGRPPWPGHRAARKARECNALALCRSASLAKYLSAIGSRALPSDSG